ncbi:Uncharacterised protein [Dorea longicatena]|nr:Uncharacterised protein [Dorea longicatena]
MSELMTPMSFEHLLNWILKEHKQYGTVFGEHDPDTIWKELRVRRLIHS